MGLERKHVISASIVGFVSWLLITAAVPSLRWVPYAFVAGALATVGGLGFLVVTTAWSHHDATHHAPPRAVPAFITNAWWEREKAALNARSVYIKNSLFSQSPTVSTRIDRLLGLVLRDFVTSWYKNISRRPLFQNEVERAIRDAMASIRDRLSGLDMVEVALTKFVPIITNHLQEFYTAERLVRGKNLTRDITESEELDLAIAGKYKDGKLHKAASLAFSDTKLMQQAHVRAHIGKVLPLVLSDEMQSSPAVTALVREIVACAVLAPMLLMLADADTWNQMIESFGRALLQDRKSVRKLRAALDEHAPASPRGARQIEIPRLRPHDSERQFERFIRAIRHTATLSDARRFRFEISSQIRKEAASSDQDTVYLRRLDAGRRILDQKIASLSSSTGEVVSGKPKLGSNPSETRVNDSSSLRQASLKEVLHTASGLSYFMEFMDRRDRMRLVQFWIIIDGFRNPLEEDTDEPTYTLHEQAQYDAADRMDIAQIKRTYLDLPELNMSTKGRKAVEDYVRAGKTASLELYIRARRAVLMAQTAVYEEMKETHFEPFRKSDLFYKWLAAEERSQGQTETLSSTDVPVRRSVDLTRPASLDISRQSSTLSPTSPHRIREGDLRRVVMSSTDLHSRVRQPHSVNTARRSVDDNASRPLFDDDIEDERMSHSVQSLSAIDSDSESIDKSAASARIVDAMQKELDDIVDGPDKESLLSEASLRSPQMSESSPSLAEFDRSSDNQAFRPNIASLGLVGGRSNTGVFTDDLFAAEEERFLSDEKEDTDGDEKPVEEDIHEAAPGDLGLKEAIATLNAEVERLTNQESIVDSLTKKAELTNNAAELRILRKSKQSLQREIRRKELQKQQYIIQESDNSLYGRAAVSIKSITVGKEEDGHEYAIYAIEVRRQAGDQMPAALWTVTRRYSEFHDLNKRLRARFAAVRNLEFPTRQTLFTLQRDFLQRRRIVLERYLRALLLIPAICRSRELRAFLSQAAISTTTGDPAKVDQGDFVARIYDSVSDGMDEFLGNLPVLDQLTVAGQNLITAASAQINGGPAGNLDGSPTLDSVAAAEAEAEINAFEVRETEPFVKPISDLFLETFELQKGNSWLRGRAVVVVLHQLLGGTVERKVRETARGFMQESSLVRYIDMVTDLMWPDGQMKPPSVPRTTAQKAHSRREATVLLSTLIPDVSASVVGRANAQAASRKIAALLNNQRLNTHLVLTLFDEIMQVIFPEHSSAIVAKMMRGYERENEDEYGEEGRGWYNPAYQQPAPQSINDSLINTNKAAPSMTKGSPGVRSGIYIPSRSSSSSSSQTTPPPDRSRPPIPIASSLSGLSKLSRSTSASLVRPPKMTKRKVDQTDLPPSDPAAKRQAHASATAEVKSAEPMAGPPPALAPKTKRTAAPKKAAAKKPAPNRAATKKAAPKKAAKNLAEAEAAAEEAAAGAAKSSLPAAVEPASGVAAEAREGSAVIMEPPVPVAETPVVEPPTATAASDPPAAVAETAAAGPRPAATTATRRRSWPNYLANAQPAFGLASIQPLLAQAAPMPAPAPASISHIEPAAASRPSGPTSASQASLQAYAAWLQETESSLTRLLAEAKGQEIIDWELVGLTQPMRNAAMVLRRRAQTMMKEFEQVQDSVCDMQRRYEELRKRALEMQITGWV